MVAKKTVELRNKKTGKLAGSVSLVGKKAPKSAAKIAPKVKKAVAEKVTVKKVTAKVVVPKDAPSTNKKSAKQPTTPSLVQVSIRLDLEASPTPGFKGSPLFAYDYPENVDKFGIILRGLSKKQIKSLADIEEKQKDQQSFINAMDEAFPALNSDLTGYTKYDSEWRTKYDSLLPSGLSEEEKDLFEGAILIASYADLALRARQEITSGTYKMLTKDWRAIVGAIHPEDKDIFVETA